MMSTESTAANGTAVGAGFTQENAVVVKGAGEDMSDQPDRADRADRADRPDKPDQPDGE